MIDKKILILLLLAITKINAQEIPQKLFENLPFAMSYINIPENKGVVMSLIDFGGAGNGKTDNTIAFKKGIDQLSKSGGGILDIPMGNWITGPIVLKSNVTIRTHKGANIIFSTNRNDYPLVKTSFEGKPSKRCQANISALNQANISIVGEGTFDGSGQVWRYVKKIKVSEEMWKDLLASGGMLNENRTIWYPSLSSYKGSLVSNIDDPKTDKQWETIRDFLRPVMIDFTSCKNVVIQGIKVVNSPSWTIHPNMCENVIINSIEITNPPYGQNTDALDIESCKNVVVYNSVISVGDDGICLKSGIDEYGRKRGIPTENVIVDNCTVLSGHGGFVIGSEMSGGVRNIKVTNCRFVDTQTGLRFKSARGRGGVVENIYVDNIEMKDIYGDAIYFDLFYGKKLPHEKFMVNETTPLFKNIYLSNIQNNGSKRAMYLNGLPEMNLQNLTLENSFFITNDGGFIGDATNIKFKNIKIEMPKTSTFKITSSNNILLDNINFNDNSKSVITISENCKAISIINTSDLKCDLVKIK